MESVNLVFAHIFTMKLFSQGWQCRLTDEQFIAVKELVG